MRMPRLVINKHWTAAALALAAGAIGYSGHDGWGWCLFLIVLIEFSREGDAR
jgi:hypothetical protein